MLHVGYIEVTDLEPGLCYDGYHSPVLIFGITSYPFLALLKMPLFKYKHLQITIVRYEFNWLFIS